MFSKTWAPIAAVIAAVLLVFQLAQAFTGNRSLVTGLLIMVACIAIGAGLWNYAFARSVIPGIPRYPFHWLAKTGMFSIAVLAGLAGIYNLTILGDVADCCGFVTTQTPTPTSSAVVILSDTRSPVFTDTAPAATLPATSTATNTAAPTSTVPPTSAVAQKVHTELTGDTETPYPVDLKDGEIIVGHGTKFEEYNEAVFLIVGPGHFDFVLRTGLWDQWINTTPALYDRLIEEQWKTMLGYKKSPILVICDASGCLQKAYSPPVPQPYMQDRKNFPAYPAPISTPHVSLQEGELLVGTAVRFAARAYGCNTMDITVNIPYTVFLIRGPIELDLEIDNGGWEKWVNEFGFDKSVAESLLQPKRDEVMKHDNYPLVGHVECIIPSY